MQLLAEEHQTLTAKEDARFQAHLAECTACRKLAGAHSDIATMATGFAEATPPTEVSLPMVDPSVFAKGAVLAKGGMGRITRAMDLRLGREVAIKEVLAPSFRARFEREALITARLQHPAIVPIYEAGTWPDGSAFYTMRLVWGTTLQKAIAERDTLEKRLALLPQVIAAVEALGYAHSRRVVHRDLKPGNILVGEFGETVVIDWGLAKEIDRADVMVSTSDVSLAADLTHAGSVMGTPCFMSPEQAAGEALDERADVYALGAIIYNLLAGHPPHWDTADHTADRLVDAARNDRPTALATLAARAPADLRAIVERAMARNPKDRYRTGKEMAEELRRFEAGQLIGSRDYTLRDLVMRWLRKHRTVLAVATVALVVVAVVGIGSIVNVMRSRAAERDAREAADKARAVSDANLTSLLEEQGRAAIVAGDRDRAIPYLVEAHARGHDGVAIRHLIAEATRDHDLLDYTTEPMHQQVTSVGYAADGTLVTVDMFDASIAQSRGATKIATKPTGKTIDASRLSPDARRAIVVSHDGSLALHEVATGAEVWAIKDPAASYPEIVFDPSGRRFAFASDVGTSLRDLETGRLVASIVTHDSPTAALAFSATGELVASVGSDGSVGIYDAATGKSLRTTKLADQGTSLVFVGPDAVVVGTSGGAAMLWRFGAAPIPLGGHRGWITEVAAHGEMVATADEAGGVRLWHLDGQLIGESRDAHTKIDDLVFSPDGTLLVGAGADKHVYIWDTSGLGLRGAIDAFHAGSSSEAYREERHGLVWNRDGTRLATLGSGEARVYVWRVPSGNRVARFASEASACAGARIVSATATELSVRELPAVAPIRTIGNLDIHIGTWATGGVLPPHVQLGRGGSRAAVWGLEHATVYDLDTGVTVARIMRAGKDVKTAVQMSDDARVLLRRSMTDELTVFDAEHGTVMRDMAAANISSVELSPKGDRVASVDWNGVTIVWTLANGAVTALADGGGFELRIDPTGRRVAVGGAKTVVVRALDTGAIIAKLAVGVDVDNMRFSDDGHRIAVRARDRSVRLWDVDANRALLSVDDVAAGGFATSPDGRFATAGDDGTVRIWDTATTRLVETIHADRTVLDLGWCGGGSRLRVQSEGMATIWDVHLDDRTASELSPLAVGWKLVDGVYVR